MARVKQMLGNRKKAAAAAAAAAVATQKQELQQPATQQKEMVAPAPAPAPPVLKTSCIDLTADDSEDDDEPLEALRDRGKTKPVAHGIMSDGIESDEDEAWPMAAATKKTRPSLHIDADPHESEEDEELPRLPLPQFDTVAVKQEALDAAISEQESVRETHRITKVNEAPSEANEAPVEETVEAVAMMAIVTGTGRECRAAEAASYPVAGHSDAKHDEAESEIDEPLTAPPAHNEEHRSGDEGEAEVAADAEAKTDKPVDPEHLEDGEIFEEGAVPKSPTEIKQAIQLERMVNAIQLSRKKNKRRGRKKAKRKMEAMMADGNQEFDRVVRQMTTYPGGMDGILTRADGDHGALLGDVPPAHYTVNFEGFPSLPTGIPAYTDEAIVRVNAMGSSEIFNGTAYTQPPLPHSTQPPQEPMLGAFRYRTITPAKPPAQLPPSTVRSMDTGDDDAAIDLDTLRLAALRTKKKAAEKRNKAAPAAPENTSEPMDVAEVDADPSSTPDIDELRLEILKSMKRKRSEGERSLASESARAAKNGAASASADEGATATMANGETTTTHESGEGSAILTTEEDDGQSDASIETQSLPSVDGDGPDDIEQDGDQSTGAAGEGVQTQRKPTELQLSSSVSATPSATPTRAQTTHSPAKSSGIGVTHRLRPLTAASQSVVIELSPSDIGKLKRVHESDGADEPSKSSAIQAAIAEMKRKIAEKEKKLQKNQSKPTETPLHCPKSDAAVKNTSAPVVQQPGEAMASTTTRSRDKTSTSEQLDHQPASAKSTVPTVTGAFSASSTVDASDNTTNDAPSSPASAESAYATSLKGYQDAKAHVERLDLEIAEVQKEIAAVMEKLRGYPNSSSVPAA